ncbi:TRAP transporter small permease [Pseudacidovorax intermedius]|uniref:TRAP transporter small permease protein n=1 Tax=Pseudacidovorax intermedius TaxID=433924 RepID=A0A147GQJ6_9BURK|nr:TRAP transporter small permease [Pseudacidovorax intermedius]KTT17196.1 C4-dicarboxylate ABC transporter permease [Pseudacidovorax intermedius]
MWGKSLDGLCRLLSAAMVVCLALMVVMVFGNVVLRYGFNSGLTLSEELSRWLFVWMTFLGALVALRSHQHLGTDTLVSRLPRVGKKLCLGASHLLMLGLCGLMLRGSWQQMWINWETTSAVMEVSMAWFYAAGVFFAALALVFVATEFLMLVTGRLAEAQLVGVTDSEDAPHGAPAQPAR